MDNRICLYRYFDADDALLYVGVSADPFVRRGQHARKDWMRELRYAEFEWFSSRSDALDAEKQAIWRERPKWNIVHARTPRALRTTPAVVEAREAEQTPIVEQDSVKPADHMPPKMFGPPAPYEQIAVSPEGVLIDGVPEAHHFRPSEQERAIKVCREGDIMHVPPHVGLRHDFWERVFANGGYRAN